MVCLIKSKYKNELAEYKRILGSEEAAYYALAANNGFMLDEDPQGNHSELYDALIASGLSHEDAIQHKVLAYMPQFTDKYGDWVTEGKPEPSIVDLNDGKSLYSNESITKIIDNKNLDKTLKKVERNNQLFVRNQLIINALDDSRNRWVQEQLQNYITIGKNPTAADIYGYSLAAQIDWDEKQISKIIGEQQEQIAKVYGLKKVKRDDGSFVYISSDDSSESKLRVAFVNSITQGQWEDEKGVKHKGMFNEQSASVNAAWNAIYISIEDGDATTFVHEMVHYYIRTFWNSQPVQDALKEVSGKVTKNKDSQQYSKSLEESLVDEIVSRTPAGQEKANIFFRGINSILSTLGHPIKENKVVANNILDTLTAAFSVNQDLSNRAAEVVLYEKYLGTVFDDPITPSSEESSDLEGSTFIRIKQTLESRRKSERSRSKANANDLLNVEEYLLPIERRDYLNKEDVKDTVTDFLTLAGLDIQRGIRLLLDLKEQGKDAIINLDPNELMHLKYDIIGYYGNMLGTDIREYVEKTDSLSRDEKNRKKQQIATISKDITDAKRLFDDILFQYVDSKLDEYAEELVAIGDKDIFKANLKLWARNSINNGELMPLEKVLGPAVNSRSPVVRLVEYLVTAQNRVTYTESLRVGHEIIDRYKKCASLKQKMSKSNFQKIFLDLDDDGNPTGYFARKYNYGKLYRKRDDIVKKLVSKYKLQVDDETGEISFETKDQYVNYMTDFYTEMDKIANFRYKKEYYIARAKMLSPEALSKEQQIQREINILVKKSRDKDLDIPLIFNLTSEEQDKLDQLQQEKKNLYSPYIIVKDSSGKIVSFEEKTGSELRIATEFMQWNKYKAEHFKYKSNWEKFNQVREHLVNKYGEDSYQVKMLDYKYKTRRIKPEFYEDFEENDNPRLQELYSRKSFIIDSIIKKKKHGVHPNLRKLNDQAFAELKKIDQEIADIYRDQDGEGKKSKSKKVWINAYDDNGQITTEIAYNYFTNAERVNRQTRGISVLEESAYTYTDASGYTSPLTVFRFLTPQDQNMVEDVLLGEFSEIDPTSDMLNTEFDENENEELQPKHTEEFVNKNWEKIQKDKNLKQFYDFLLSVMREAYSNLPNMDPEKMQYVMPQMRDRDIKLLFRNRHILNNMGASIADAISITERETMYNEDFSTRPDGSIIETIPIRWITRLKDPSIISTDITQSVAMFYEMSLNYKNKAEINPMLQAMLFMTQGGFSEQSKESDRSDQAQRIQNFLQMYVNGRMRVGVWGNKNSPMSKSARVSSRIVDTVLAKAHAKLMNHNWRAILKNFVDSFLTETGEILCGKYITVVDALFANKEMGSEIFSQVKSFGRANNKSKIAALMQLNGCSGTIAELFGQHNETWLRRIISKHFSMGEYTLVDYTFKGHYLTALYHSIRLVKNPKTKKLEFMTKDQAMYHYQNAGLGIDEGLKQWKNADKTLWDAYEVDDKGNAYVVDEYKDYVYPYVESLGRRTNRLVNQVAGIIRERSSVINGVLDTSGSASMRQSTIGAMVLQMRGWMISQMWDNLKDGNDFAIYQKQWKLMFEQQRQQQSGYGSTQMPGVKQIKPNQDLNKYTAKMPKQSTKDMSFAQRMDNYFSTGINEDPELHGQYNFETGNVETGQWRGLGRAAFHGLTDVLKRTMMAYKSIRGIENSEAYQRRLTRNERYKLRRLSTMAATFMIMCACTYFTTLAAAKWPDKWYLHLLSAVNISAISERASQLPVFAWTSILDIVNSMIISKTLIEDADKIVNALWDLVELTEDKVFGVEGLSYKDPVRGGAYNKMSNISRDWLKVMSYTDFNIDNVFRSVLPSGNKASINYYIHNVSPTKQAYEAANLFVPWMLGLVGIDLGEPKNQTPTSTSSSSGRKSSGRTGGRGGGRR